MSLSLDSNKKYLSLNTVMGFFLGIILITSFAPKAVQTIQNNSESSTSNTGKVSGSSFAGVSLDENQIDTANQIIKTGKGMGMSDREIVTALMTAMQESTLINDGRRDDWFWLKHFGTESESRGVFQQIHSWGTEECRMNVSCAAKLFFNAMMEVPNRESLSENDLAATIQKPAEEYRGKYEQHKPMAEALLAAWKPDQNFSIDAATTKETNNNFSGITDIAASVVCVKIMTDSGLECGSGVAIKPDQILTNYHMTGNNIVRIQSGEEFQGKVIKSDPKLDLAIIQVEGLNLPVVNLGDAVSEGAPVTAMGHPGGGNELIKTQGTIVGTNQLCGIPNSPLAECYSISAGTINRGNSGGALVANGVLIGINNSMSKSDGTGRALPMSVVKQFLSSF